ncbi:MAG: hypothetical protein CR997_08175 [Acidobacteria bacterium]|nr:MAG: hypothetical protein CR997_08175 [Acidobacteriota bacterium]
MRMVLALTGASGAIYFQRCLERLRNSDLSLELISSSHGRSVLEYETGKTWDDLSAGLTVHEETNMAASVSSGSTPTYAMIVVPCSMSSLCQIASGISENLIHRVAAVQLKERRKLILVPRETPYSLIHLRAMTALTEAGALILPASPGFYHRPACVEEVVDGVVDRILDHIGLPDTKIKRWQS